jgi:hypothetical protein
VSIIGLNIMTDPEYAKMVWKSIRKLRSLFEHRNETDLEIAKVRQFARATINMLPDEQRRRMERMLALVDNSDTLGRIGLTDAVRNVLEQSPKQWFTVAQVRDALQDAGFDFSSYTSNPLSSVSTTLKRIKSPDIESAEIEGVTAYRSKNTKIAKKRRADLAEMEAIAKYHFSQQNPALAEILIAEDEEKKD